MNRQGADRSKTVYSMRLLFQRLGRWAAAGVLGCVVGVGSLHAQDPGADPSSKTYLNKSAIQLPIVVESGARSQLQAVQLFVREGAAGVWTLKDTVAPDQEFFTFRATREGEYWFNIVSVDRMGRRTPADVSKEAPALMVVIDSQAPALEVSLAGNTNDGNLVHCEIRDANPDYLKTRFSYQTRDGQWRFLEPVTNRPDLFCIPVQAVHTGLVRIAATDLAGNTTSREFNLGALAMRPHLAGDPRQTAQGAPVQNTSTLPAASMQTPPLETPRNIARGPDFAQPPIGTQVAGGLPNSPIPQQVVQQRPAQQPVQQQQIPQATSPYDPAIQLSTFESPTTPALPREKQIASPAATTADMPMPENRRISNQTRVKLDYQIETKGPSGVGRIEVWATRDMGQSWQKIHEDQDRQPPLELNLPGEGLFGLVLTAINGRGIGSQPPKTGDAPDMWIEVDTTRPVAALTDIRLGGPEDGGALHIRWSARDRNLAAQPIDLFYSATREGPWTPIARNVRNDGYFKWTAPTEAGAQAFIRIAVRDLANNVTITETQQTVALGDTVKPKARILDIVPAGGTTTGSTEATNQRPLQVTNTPPLPPVDNNFIPRP